MRYWLALFTLSALLLGAPATAQTPAAVTGCVYISGGITLSNGQRTAFQCDVNGKLLTTGGGSGGAASVSNSDGTLTISPTTGAVVASLALGHANTWTAKQTFPAGSATAPGVVVGVGQTGLFSTGAGTLLFSANGVQFADFGDTQSGTLFLTPNKTSLDVGGVFWVPQTSGAVVSPGVGGSYGFSTNSVANSLSTVDTNISRISSGVVGVGNGTPGDFSGTIKASGFNAGGNAGITHTCTLAAALTLIFTDGILTGGTC